MCTSLFCDEYHRRDGLRSLIIAPLFHNSANKPDSTFRFKPSIRNLIVNKFTNVVCAIFGLLMLSVSYAGPIDINTASADDIAANLKGVGAKQAAAIVEYRKQNGPFTSLESISNVKGVGAKTIANNQENILLKGAKAVSTQPAMPSKTATPKLAQQPVNINTASADELTALPGIGPAKADAIIKYRQDIGPFQTIDDLLNIKGIGEKTLLKNRDMIRL
ncbi:MAG: ComEA family DNA-binding protein [Gammaproteobacteria bacterium]